MDGADSHHAGVERADFTRDDGLQAGDQVRRGNDGIDRGVRIGSVAGDAAHHDAEAVAGGVGGALDETELAHRDVRVVVEAERHVHAVERTIGDHRFGAAKRFFGRLEEQPDCAGKFRRNSGEDGGDAQQSGAVHIMAAGVHLARVLAAKSEAGAFLDRQRVHVGADGEQLAGSAPLDGADDAGAADAGLGGDAEAGEFARDDTGGTDFLEGEFGMGVEVASDLDQVGLCLAGGVGDGCADIVDVAHPWRSAVVQRAHCAVFTGDVASGTPT